MMPKTQASRAIGMSAVLVAFLLVTIFGALLAPWDIADSDWMRYFRPAALHPLDDPYRFAWACYPPWLFLLLHPIAILPPSIGYGVFISLGFVTLAVYCRDWWRVLLLALSMPVLAALHYGQVDIFLPLAFLLPPQWSLLLVTCKPHILGWWALARAWRGGLRLFLPVVAVTLCSFLVWGFWPARVPGSTQAVDWRTSHSISQVGIIGAILLVVSGPMGQAEWLALGLLTSPYVLFYHLVPVLAFIYRRERAWVLIGLTVITWLVGLAMVKGGFYGSTYWSIF